MAEVPDPSGRRSLLFIRYFSPMRSPPGLRGGGQCWPVTVGGAGRGPRMMRAEAPISEGCLLFKEPCARCRKILSSPSERASMPWGQPRLCLRGH